MARLPIPPPGSGAPRGSTNSIQVANTGIGGGYAQSPYGGMAARPRSNLFGALLDIFQPPRITPYQQAGRRGTSVWGGYVENIEKDRRLSGQNRYRTASDMLANVSIIAAGLRFFLNLVAVPTWTVKPAEDLGTGKSSDEAKKLADFCQDILDNLGTNWSRVVRRSGMYKFHGYGIHEWVASRREDGLIGISDLMQRPQHTIERWELADDGTIIGMWQRWPQNGELLFLPRPKVVYLVDDMMTDSPEGLGFFRHLVDPAERIRRYLKMEGLGYERDMRGLPVGRAPLAELQRQLSAGDITDEQYRASIGGMENFLRLQVKEEDSSLLLDSMSYRSPNADGYNVSNEKLWDLELLHAGAVGFEDINRAIDRLTHDMARILGVESLLLGGQGGGSGSKALSEDKSRNLYLMVNGTTTDIAEAYRRDMIGAVWTLNGLPDKLMPTLHTEDVAFKDAEQVAKALADMATAGAILAPDDPAINDIRDMLGVSRQPEEMAELGAAAAMLPRAVPPKGGALQPPGTGAPAPVIEGDSGPKPGVPGPAPAPAGAPPRNRQGRRTESSTPQ